MNPTIVNGNEISIQEKFALYIEINKQLKEARLKQKQTKQVLTKLEEDIQKYMVDNKMDNISTKDGSIVLYEQKKSLTFKKESISDCLVNKLDCNLEQAEKIADSILENKVFNTAKKIKANLKKQPKN